MDKAIEIEVEHAAEDSWREVVEIMPSDVAAAYEQIGVKRRALLKSSHKAGFVYGVLWAVENGIVKKHV